VFTHHETAASFQQALELGCILYVRLRSFFELEDATSTPVSPKHDSGSVINSSTESQKATTSDSVIFTIEVCTEKIRSPGLERQKRKESRAEQSVLQRESHFLSVQKSSERPLCICSILQTLDQALKSDLVTAFHRCLWAGCWSHIRQVSSTSTKDAYKKLHSRFISLGYAASYILDCAKNVLDKGAIR
jgi:hypothetical protein